MKNVVAAWQFWAVLSAVFAALTAIFAKVGVEGINSDFATFVRTIVIICVLAVILTALGEWQQPADVGRRTYVFLILSGSRPARRGYAISVRLRSARRRALHQSTNSASCWWPCSEWRSLASGCP